MIYPIKINYGARRCQMDKRMLENKRVRTAIAKAWIALLKEKSFSEIKVTDLVNEPAWQDSLIIVTLKVWRMWQKNICQKSNKIQCVN